MWIDDGTHILYTPCKNTHTPDLKTQPPPTEANNLGWQLDAEHNVLCIDAVCVGGGMTPCTPTSPIHTIHTAQAPNKQSTEQEDAAYARGYQQLKQLTEYVVHFQV